MQVLITRSTELTAPGGRFFPCELGFLCCGGRVGRGDMGQCCCLFPFCHVCESDYRSLSQYLASADSIIVEQFIFSGPRHICCQCHARSPAFAATGKESKQWVCNPGQVSQAKEWRVWNHDLQLEVRPVGASSSLRETLMDLMRGQRSPWLFTKWHLSYLGKKKNKAHIATYS